MEIKASQVKELRDMTGVAMMDCKKALVESNGDIEKAAEILHDDLRWIDGNTNNREWGGKQRVLNNISWFKNYFDYVSFKDSEGAYPDMLEYKRSGNWVQSWVNIYAVHKITGFKLDHPVLRIYSLNDDSL